MALGAHFYGVGELVVYIQEVFAGDPVLSDVWVAGEIADLVQSAAGHTYFTIRDQDGRIPAVMFRSAARRQTLPLIPGFQALIHGTVGLYEQRSTVQLIADIVLPGDAGRLQAEFEALRLRLEAEGLFALERKRPLPRLPQRIGIVTSESGAVIHDMLTVWNRRYRSLELVLSATAVQGEDAPRQIVAAFARLHEYHVARRPLDLIVLARGGGSPEELATFNDERVARAIFAAPVPVVSAVGHEVDTTIADLVADVRAPTPSAAAEIVVPDAADLCREVDFLVDHIAGLVERQIAAARADVASAENRLEWHAPTRVLADRRREVDGLAMRATRSLESMLALARTQVAGSAAQLEALSPLLVLGRGYAVATRETDGHVLTRAADADVGATFTLRLSEGAVRGQVLERQAQPGGADQGSEEAHRGR
jgi:exodeoxyribonuclease VII large subunit